MKVKWSRVHTSSGSAVGRESGGDGGSAGREDEGLNVITLISVGAYVGGWGVEKGNKQTCDRKS